MPNLMTTIYEGVSQEEVLYGQKNSRGKFGVQYYLAPADSVSVEGDSITLTSLPSGRRRAAVIDYYLTELHYRIHTNEDLPVQHTLDLLEASSDEEIAAIISDNYPFSCVIAEDGGFYKRVTIPSSLPPSAGIVAPYMFFYPATEEFFEFLIQKYDYNNGVAMYEDIQKRRVFLFHWSTTTTATPTPPYVIGKYPSTTTHVMSNVMFPEMFDRQENIEAHKHFAYYLYLLINSQFLDYVSMHVPDTSNITNEKVICDLIGDYASPFVLECILPRIGIHLDRSFVYKALNPSISYTEYLDSYLRSTDRLYASSLSLRLAYHPSLEDSIPDDGEQESVLAEGEDLITYALNNQLAIATLYPNPFYLSF